MLAPAAAASAQRSWVLPHETAMHDGHRQCHRRMLCITHDKTSSSPFSMRVPTYTIRPHSASQPSMFHSLHLAIAFRVIPACTSIRRVRPYSAQFYISATLSVALYACKVHRVPYSPHCAHAHSTLQYTAVHRTPCPCPRALHGHAHRVHIARVLASHSRGLGTPAVTGNYSLSRRDPPRPYPPCVQCPHARSPVQHPYCILSRIALAACNVALMRSPRARHCHRH